MTSSRYDVIVVGARCAGSPLATHLARAGLDVCLVDRARFPSDTLSTHYFEAEGVAALDRLGVLPSVLATGAPMVENVEFRIDDLRVVDPIPRRPDDHSPALCVRRPALDAVLIEAAGQAGAEIRTSARVTGVTTKNGRVVGVRVTGEDDREHELEAALVVGADGMGSTVARLVGARRYHVVSNQRFIYWGYYEGARWDAPAVVFQRWGEELLFGCPCDAGLYVAAMLSPLDRLPAFKADPEAVFAAHLAAGEATTVSFEGARRVGPLRGMASYPAFFRESAGPGWVLVGDAGHFKDPAMGQGISDALRQAERLAAAVVSGLGGSAPADAALRAWWRDRDADELEHHWLASDLGAAGTVTTVIREALGRLHASPGGLSDFYNLFHHRARPSKVLTPGRMLAATVRLALRGREHRRPALREFRALAALDRQRRRLRRHPQLVEDGRAVTAPETSPPGPLGGALVG